ncbi:MAG: sigma-54 dependent transcriptional regulator [Halieaceae bacterium]|nr:sigma-54 dependent transcriptional regulator [Halieaceae bacterium]
MLSAIIGNSPAILAVKSLIEQVAPSDATVLVRGPSGAGKELVAKALHELSARAKHRFIPINCAAIPRELLESELFGHRKGAFSGAIGDHKGRFELAHNGTLFLDEIGDMPMDLQVKLLRVLQERKVDPIGSQQSIDVNVRVIAATHKDLEKAVATGEFREDLYYRLNVIPLALPSLAERKDDITELFARFAEVEKRNGNAPVRLSSFSQAALKQYTWPGNIRELQNLAHRFTALYAGQEVDLRQIPETMLPPKMLAIMASLVADYPVVPATEPDCDDSHNFEDLGLPNIEGIVRMAQGMPALPDEGLVLKDHIAQIERDIIHEALQRTAHNVSQTARLLSIRRTTLIEKINKYELANSAQSA